MTSSRCVLPWHRSFLVSLALWRQGNKDSRAERENSSRVNVTRTDIVLFALGFLLPSLVLAVIIVRF